MLKFWLTFLCALSALCASSISWDEIVRDPEHYIYGEGEGETVAEAKEAALAQLSRQITTYLEVTGTIEHNSLDINGKNTRTESQYSQTIHTYSSATITNALEIRLADNPRVKIGLYMLKENVNQIFDIRREKIYKYVDIANQAASSGNVDIALRSYYWAYALLRSLPNPDSEMYDGEQMSVTLPAKLQTILNDVKVHLKSKSDEYTFQCQFLYKGKPVNSLDYSYNDGGFYSPLCNASEGIGEMQMSSADTQSIEVRIEYEYRDQWRLDPEVRAVLERISDFPLNNFCYVTAGDNAPRTVVGSQNNNTNTGSQQVLSTPSTNQTTQPSVQGLQNTNTNEEAQQGSFTNLDPSVLKLPETMSNDSFYRERVNSIVNAIESKNRGSINRSYFTPTGYQRFQAVISNGKAKVVDRDNLMFWQRDDGTVVCRGVVMTFNFRSGTYRSFTRDVVFTFNKEGLIDNITYGLGSTVRDNVLGQSAYPEEVRHRLMDFIENYQTAFALKDSTYLESIFDDNAIIIVGNVSYPQYSRENYVFRTNKHIEYNRRTKREYLDGVKKAFDSQEYISVRFNTMDVRQVQDNKNCTYGLQLEQDYFSPRYCDHGYLFLMIDMENPDLPIILVRTWQPEADPNFGLYDEQSFPIVRYDY